MMLLSFPVACPGQVDRVEPPFWWTGMVNPRLQLMVHGEQIAGSVARTDHEGIQVVATTSLESSNYIFIDLELLPGAEPGRFTIDLIREKKQFASFEYELRARETGSADREGFNNSDVIYLVMPDRWANGDPGNDVVTGLREQRLDRTDRLARHGGDLKGLVDHLDYMEKMGFSALWLNPVLMNDMERSSYHGYSTTDYYMVDPRFGSNEELRELSLLAQEKGIKMIMDMVFNHIGSFHPWMEDPPAADWINHYPGFVPTNHRRTVNQDPYASETDRERMADGWFVSTMPDLNQDNSFLSTYLIQNSIWWIEFGVLAGIRMDTYPYPEKEMMAEWCSRVLDEYPDFNIVGEEWSTNPGLVSYWQRGKINRDGYRGNVPSLMDFPLQSALGESLLKKDDWDSGWLTLYETLASDYEYPDPYNLVVFPDNHDMSRFYMQVGMDDELYRLGITYILTTRGIPQIFYGSEILMTHTESDHHGDIRKDFPGGWEGDPVNAFTGEGLSEEAQQMQQFFMKLLNWRRENQVIHTGKLIHYAPEKGTYVYGRYNREKTVMVILNKNAKTESVSIERFAELTGNHTYGIDVITGERVVLDGEVTVPAKTGYILELH